MHYAMAYIPKKGKKREKSIIFPDDMLIVEQGKPETVSKVCDIVKKQLALAESISVTGESKFSDLGADSLDTV